MENFNQELYHYGVKGMKWGVRKSDRKTLQQRIADKKAKNEVINKQRASDRKAYTEYASLSKESRRKSASNMSDQHKQSVRRGAKVIADESATTGAMLGTLINAGNPVSMLIGGTVSAGASYALSRIKSNVKLKDLNTRDIETGKQAIVMLTSSEASKLGYNDSTRVAGKEEEEFWKAYAKQFE